MPPRPLTANFANSRQSDCLPPHQSQYPHPKRKRPVKRVCRPTLVCLFLCLLWWMLSACLLGQSESASESELRVAISVRTEIEHNSAEQFDRHSSFRVIWRMRITTSKGLKVSSLKNRSTAPPCTPKHVNSEPNSIWNYHRMNASKNSKQK